MIVDGEFLFKNLDRFLLVDPRPPVKYFSGHIKGAVNVRVDKILLALRREDFKEAFDLLGKGGIDLDTEILIYDDLDGQKACTMAWILEYFGHKKIYLLNEKVESWLNRYGEKAYRPSNPNFKKFEGEIVKEIRANWEEIYKNLNKIKLLDVRSEEEYSGKLVLHDRPGHIPKAINLPWKRFLHEGNKIFKENIEVREIKRDDEIIVYCSDGPRACVAYYALKLIGFNKVKVYDKSFSEWASLADLPVEI